MPIYEFHCQKCGADSELLIRSRRWEGTPCPKCGSTKLSKKLSVFASSARRAILRAGVVRRRQFRFVAAGAAAGGRHSH